MTVLVLGGTGEARALAGLLVDAGIDVMSSLAGAVSQPRLPAGPTRVGGFGGVTGLADFLASQRVSAVVDATHPFAARISANAVAACGSAGVPLLRLARPGWSDHPDSARWHWVADHEEAAATAARLGQRVLLTTGRQHLDELVAGLGHHTVVARVVDPPEIDLPATWQVIRSRGPYDLVSERDLLHTNAIDVLVTKDSGGALTVAKLDAARELGVEVVVVRRPVWPGESTTPQVSSAASAYDWIVGDRAQR